MSTELTMKAKVRSVAGKGASRRLRRQKRVPSILYGAGKAALMLEVSAFELARLMESESFYSQILSLDIDGQGAEPVVLKDMQRHPFKDIVLHVDFQRVQAGERLHRQVPLHFANEDHCAGVRAGGVLHKDAQEVAVIALPGDLPEYIEVDLTDLALGSAIHLSQLQLPAGVELEAFAHGADAHDSDQPVVSVFLPRGASSSAGDAEGDEA